MTRLTILVRSDSVNLIILFIMCFYYKYVPKLKKNVFTKYFLVSYNLKHKYMSRTYHNTLF